MSSYTEKFDSLVRLWAAEMLRNSIAGRVTRTAAYKTFLEWGKRGNHLSYTPSQHAFSLAMGRLGRERYRANGVYYWIGVALVERADPAPSQEII